MAPVSGVVEQVQRFSGADYDFSRRWAGLFAGCAAMIAMFGIRGLRGFNGIRAIDAIDAIQAIFAIAGNNGFSGNRGSCAADGIGGFRGNSGKPGDFVRLSLGADLFPFFLTQLALEAFLSGLTGRTDSLFGHNYAFVLLA